jgi:diguanylate cyclase (GGDEF)-like protein
LAAAWSAAELERTPLALVLFDIDYFKRFNDTYGHLAGDTCLRAVGEAVVACVREGDTAARYGGEEFALILPGTTLSAAEAAAERVRSVVLNLGIRHARGTAEGCVTVSLGVAGATPGAARPDPDNAETPALLIEAADRCLYAAKARGRNCVVAARPAPVEGG